MTRHSLADGKNISFQSRRQSQPLLIKSDRSDRNISLEIPAPTQEHNAVAFIKHPFVGCPN